MTGMHTLLRYGNTVDEVKDLECLSAGLPVLTAEIGAEGIDARLSDGLIVLPPDPEIFLRMICSLERDRSRLAELGAAASRWGDCVNKNQSSVLLG